jgi:hypothetical protein
VSDHRVSLASMTAALIRSDRPCVVPAGVVHFQLEVYDTRRATGGRMAKRNCDRHRTNVELGRDVEFLLDQLVQLIPREKPMFASRTRSYVVRRVIREAAQRYLPADVLETSRTMPKAREL